MKQQHFLPPPAFLAFLASLPPCLPARLRACLLFCLPAARRTEWRRGRADAQYDARCVACRPFKTL